MQESNSRKHLAKQVLTPRDIAASTLKRWPHGYSYSNSLTWSEQFAEEDKPWVIGRQPSGNIHITNSNSASSSTTKAVIKQAHGAVSGIMG